MKCAGKHGANFGNSTHNPDGHATAQARVLSCTILHTDLLLCYSALSPLSLDCASADFVRESWLKLMSSLVSIQPVLLVVLCISVGTLAEGRFPGREPQLYLYKHCRNTNLKVVSRI